MAPFILRNPRLPSVSFDIKLRRREETSRRPGSGSATSSFPIPPSLVFTRNFQFLAPTSLSATWAATTAPFLTANECNRHATGSGRSTIASPVVRRISSHSAVGVSGREVNRRAGNFKVLAMSSESPPAAADRLPLSAAERRVFDLILSGHAEKEVATRLEISRHTVHCHVRKIYRTLHVRRSRAELLAKIQRFARMGSTGPSRRSPTAT